MVIDVIDMENPAVGNDVKNGLSRRGMGMSNGIGQMVSNIMQCAPQGGVSDLRIWSQGCPGGQTISGGYVGEDGRVQHWTGISREAAKTLW